jgi:prophage antirepressor-like protein
MAKQTTPVVFQSTTFDIVDRNGQTWLRGHQIGVALGYARTDIIQKLYRQHADEFTGDMTAVVRLPTEGGEQEVRIFSPRGCYALGMFARTKVAKDFRVWVLDVLEGRIMPPARSETHEFNLRAVMMEGNTTPTVPLTQAVQKAVNRRAWGMAHEAYELARAFIERRVAYKAALGVPRRIDFNLAMAAIRECTLDMALAPRHYNMLEQIMTSSELLAIAAENQRAALHEEFSRLTGENDE